MTARIAVLAWLQQAGAGPCTVATAGAGRLQVVDFANHAVRARLRRHLHGLLQLTSHMLYRLKKRTPS